MNSRSVWLNSARIFPNDMQPISASHETDYLRFFSLNLAGPPLEEHPTCSTRCPIQREPIRRTLYCGLVWLVVWLAPETGGRAEDGREIGPLRQKSAR
jgi:hypothetical protein